MATGTSFPLTTSSTTVLSGSAQHARLPARQPSLSSFPSNGHMGNKRAGSGSTQSDVIPGLHQSSQPSSAQSYFSMPRQPRQLVVSQKHAQQQKPIKSQYPADSIENHVEYILVASFDIDRGSVMEHQYPGPVGGDAHMLAELMLPDQAHVRAQDWTTFFLHKDAAEEEEGGRGRRRKRRRKLTPDGQMWAGPEENGVDAAEEYEAEYVEESDDDDSEGLDGPPLVYVLNLVNTKHDTSTRRGAIVKAMAICTRHSFLHIYKPLLLLALEQYFANPVVETLAELYDAVNSMDLSLMPKLSLNERIVLQSSDAKDLFLERFESLIAQRMNTKEPNGPKLAPPSPAVTARNRFGLPRDTHEFESVVKYSNVPVPVKVPTALSPETVGDFSLIKLITTFSGPHSTMPQAFNPTHPHLTTSGPTTHPVIVLLNALLTQKRIIFLGHNLPSSEVAEAVLAACALASGGLLRGFTRHAFPYTDLTKIDDLLKVPGFIAGVTNPAFAHKTEWWDLLCDLPTGRMRISNRIEAAQLTEGVAFFQQAHPGSGFGVPTPGSGISAIAAAGASLSAGLGGNATPSASMGGDATGDAAFMTDVLKAIEERHGENAVRGKFRRWVLKFARLASAFEETVYGASALHVQAPTNASPHIGLDSPSPTDSGSAMGAKSPDLGAAVLPPEVAGHGYVWATAQSKAVELAANATRIEGWRNTRSYYNFIQDLAAHFAHRPIKELDLHHLHDKLAKLRLGPDQAANIYLAICAAAVDDAQLCQLLAVLSVGSWDTKGGPSPQGQGLFHLALGLFHAKMEVREQVAELLLRVQEHEAGRHFWASLGRFAKIGWERVMAGREARLKGIGETE